MNEIDICPIFLTSKLDCVYTDMEHLRFKTHFMQKIKASGTIFGTTLFQNTKKHVLRNCYIIGIVFEKYQTFLDTNGEEKQYAFIRIVISLFISVKNRSLENFSIMFWFT